MTVCAFGDDIGVVFGDDSLCAFRGWQLLWILDKRFQERQPLTSPSERVYLYFCSVRVYSFYNTYKNWPGSSIKDFEDDSGDVIQSDCGNPGSISSLKYKVNKHWILIRVGKNKEKRTTKKTNMKILRNNHDNTTH